MPRDLNQIRNIGIVAHIDAGKTTVTERMLYYSGVKHRVGEVDKGTAEMDDDPEEQERGITIYAACITFRWGDFHINLLDTPGHVDFTAEVERCLRVLDSAVVVFSAREGVEAQSETVWRQANRYDLPRIAFVNKMDREGADFEAVLAEMEDRLQARPVAVQIPVGAGPAHGPDPFRGVIDLVDMAMLRFEPPGDGRQVLREPIPEPLRDTAAAWREAMLEHLYRYSDELMERALEEAPVSAELVRRVIRQATLMHQIQPVFCGSALRGVGVQPLLDAVGAYLASPGDRPPVRGVNPAKKNAEQVRPPDPEAPFCGLVFKVLPAKTADLHWVRVYSGRLKANSRVLVPAKNKRDNVAQLWQIHGTRKEREGQVRQVEAGDIVGVVGMRHAITGDTVCDPRHPILLESIAFPETVISMAVEPESQVERKKLAEALEMLHRQDPTLRVSENEGGQTLISGMGELHLEIVKHRLLRDFRVNIRFHKPQVSYRETIRREVDAVGVCRRQLGGRLLQAGLTIRMIPCDTRGQGVLVLNSCPEDVLPPPLAAAAVEELNNCGQGGGPLGGYPLMNIQVVIAGAELHEEGSDETAFRIAAHDAFEHGLQAAGPVLLEPVMRLDIMTPEQYVGDVVGDLQQRRAEIVRTEARGALTLIEARAPLAELFGYSGALRSLSQGRASCSIEPLQYAPVPEDVLQRFQL